MKPSHLTSAFVSRPATKKTAATMAVGEHVESASLLKYVTKAYAVMNKVVALPTPAFHNADRMMLNAKIGALECRLYAPPLKSVTMREPAT